MYQHVSFGFFLRWCRYVCDGNYYLKNAQGSGRGSLAEEFPSRKVAEGRFDSIFWRAFIIYKSPNSLRTVVAEAKLQKIWSRKLCLENPCRGSWGCGRGSIAKAVAEGLNQNSCIIHVTVDDVSPVQGTRVMKSISLRAFARSALSRERRLHRHGPTYQCRWLWIIGKLINLKWKTSLLKGMMLTLRAGLFLKRLVPCKSMWCICQAARYWLRSPQPSITPPPAKQSFLAVGISRRGREMPTLFPWVLFLQATTTTSTCATYAMRG